MSTFKISVWSRSKHPTSKPLGKSYGIKNGKLFKEDLGTNAKYVKVENIDSLDDLEFVIDFDLHKGDAFITSGVPKNTDIKEAEVTVRGSKKKTASLVARTT